jgi:hypothetical protein
MCPCLRHSCLGDHVHLELYCEEAASPGACPLGHLRRCRRTVGEYRLQESVWTEEGVKRLGGGVFVAPAGACS